MSDQYYALYLDDYATPAFCSFDKLFIGTQSEILAVADRMGADIAYKETVAAIQNYFLGKKTVTHTIAYQTFPVLTPVESICSLEFTLNETIWNHQNVWDCTYIMKFDEAVVHQLLIQHQNKYYRLIRASMKNLCCDSETSFGWMPLNSRFWGHKCMMNVTTHNDGSYWVSNLLYVIQDSFDSLDDANNYWRDPGKLIFDSICDEIFGDG